MTDSLAIPRPVQLGMLNVALVVIGIAGLVSKNPLESIFAVVQLKIILQAFWRQSSPPIAVLLFFLPWLEISTGIFEANIRQETLDDMLHNTGKRAYWLSSIGLYAVLIGFYPFFLKGAHFSQDQLRQKLEHLSFNRLVLTYFLIGPVSSFISGFIGRGALFQLLTYINEISIVLLILICLRQAIVKQINSRFIAFLTVVTILSFYSLFSSWKIVAFALFISLGITENVSRKLVIRVIVLAGIFGNLIFLWQGIKQDYRRYITGSAEKGALVSQRVVVSQEEALNKFFELAGTFYSADRTSLEAGTDEELIYATLRRAGYLEFFALVLNRVPDEIDHTNGELLSSSLSFALIPRFLNPNKGIKDDGEKVERFTGFMVGDAASFSLGHYVEYFIDFRSYGMILFLMAYGIIGGIIYRFLMQLGRKQIEPFLVLPLIYVCLDKWGTFQADTVFLYGQTFFGTICHGMIFLPVYRAITRILQVDHHE